MRRFLAPILLLTLLFPTLAMGGEVKWSDLVLTDGLRYKKFSDVPFTGKVTEKLLRVSFRNGKRHGPWGEFHDNGRLKAKGTYKAGEGDGL